MTALRLALLAAAEPAKTFEGKVTTVSPKQIMMKLADGGEMGFGPTDLAPKVKIHAGASERKLSDIKTGDALTVRVSNGGFGAIEEIAIASGGTAKEGCPKQGHRLGKDAEGRDICIRDGVMTCPKGFSQLMGSDSRFHCMSAPAAKCVHGQAMKDREGRSRCEMPKYDECPDGDRVLRLPDGKYSCASPM
jgi:hypothetical protein